MATTFTIYLPEHAPPGAVDAAVEAVESLEGLEQRWTVYDAASEVSRINAAAGTRPVRVSHATASIIRRAIEISDATAGAFDITAGPLVDAWGFSLRRGGMPDDAAIEAARASVNFRDVCVDVDERTVELRRRGMKINLGGIGKGAAVDRLASRMRESGVEDFLIHGGGSSVYAAGDQNPPDDDASVSAPPSTAEEANRRADLVIDPQTPNPRGWRVDIAHPTRSGASVGSFWVRNSAVGTSGSGKRFFHYRGRRYGHVIDPRTGRPAGDWSQVTVITPHAADADALGTAMFVLGDAPRPPGFDPPPHAVLPADPKPDQPLHWRSLPS